MIFHTPQPSCVRRVCKQAHAGTLIFTSQIASSICAVAFTKRVKRDAAIFGSRCSRTVVGYRLDRVQALPLVWTRILRLAQISPLEARSPARRPHDDREISGKTSGEISRRKSESCPGNGRAVATAMPPDVRQGDSQDNLCCTGYGRAMSAPETCETTRNTVTRQPCHGQGNISQGNSLKFQP